MFNLILKYYWLKRSRMLFIFRTVAIFHHVYYSIIHSFNKFWKTKLCPRGKNADKKYTHPQRVGDLSLFLSFNEICLTWAISVYYNATDVFHKFSKIHTKYKIKKYSTTKRRWTYYPEEHVARKLNSLDEKHQIPDNRNQETQNILSLPSTHHGSWIILIFRDQRH